MRFPPRVLLKTSSFICLLFFLSNIFACVKLEICVSALSTTTKTRNISLGNPSIFKCLYHYCYWAIMRIKVGTGVRVVNDTADM